MRTKRGDKKRRLKNVAMPSPSWGLPDQDCKGAVWKKEITIERTIMGIQVQTTGMDHK